jgi:hypothetical protein
MKTLGCFFAIAPTVTLLALSAHADGRRENPAPPVIQYESGLLTVHAREHRLRDLLQAVAHKGDLSIVSYAALDEAVSFAFDRLPLDQGLRRILRRHSFVLEPARHADAEPSTAPPSRRTLWILPAGGDPSSGHVAWISNADLDEPAEDRRAQLALEISQLQGALASEDAEERQDAIVALGDTEDAAAIPSLRAALTDVDENVRRSAASALGAIGGTDAAQVLAVALHDRAPRVREEAVDALRDIGDEVAVSLLRRALADEQEFVRAAAADAIEELTAGDRASGEPP